MPLVDWRAADGQEELLRQRPGDRAEGEGRIGRAEGGDADLGDRLAGGFRENAEAVEVRRLALVGRHAEGGVALGVLHRLVALALGEFEVGGGHVVLVVDEVLVAFIVLAGGGCEPDRLHRLLVGLHGGGHCERGWTLHCLESLLARRIGFAQDGGARRCRWQRQRPRWHRGAGPAGRTAAHRRSGSCRRCGTRDAAPDSSRLTWRRNRRQLSSP
jgi:hypothetical protein